MTTKTSVVISRYGTIITIKAVPHMKELILFDTLGTALLADELFSLTEYAIF